MYLIKKYEGLRLQAYQCPMGIWTIGYGNTSYPDGRRVAEGDVITQEYADALLTDYLIKEVYPAFFYPRQIAGFFYERKAHDGIGSSDKNNLRRSPR